MKFHGRTFVIAGLMGCALAISSGPAAATPLSAGSHHAGDQIDATALIDLAQHRGGGHRGMGPLHVLEHADALALSPAQRERTKVLFEAMKAEATPLGERLIEEETALDRLFATNTAGASSLEAATRAIGATQGELRAAHLRYHLAMMEVLTPEQVRRYGELRGYGAGHGQGGHGAHPR